MAKIIGKRSGRLVVLGMLVRDPRARNHKYVCQCDCGAFTTVLRPALYNAGKQSCGCLMREYVDTLRKEERDKDHPLYPVWTQMRARCRVPSHPSYKDYGGRGIKVCARWDTEGGFHRWLRDMGPRPDGLTIERRNNDGDYEPDNCYWATQREQNLNQRRSKKNRGQ